jgi:zinc transporter, ZIP family
VTRLGRIPPRAWALAVPVCVLGTAVVLGLARPWDHPAARNGEIRVQQATLRFGQVVLVLVNDSDETARVAQVIFNDAFVDFRQSQPALKPGDADRITVAYPWIRGESYEVELMTSTGATVDYDLEEAEPGTRSESA